MTLCVHQYPAGEVIFRQDSQSASDLDLDITEQLQALELDTWHTLAWRLSPMTEEFDASQMKTPFLLWADDVLELSIGEVLIKRIDLSEAA